MPEFVRLGCFAALLVAGLPAPVQAQWSADPAANLVVSDLPGRQSRPMIAPTADGGFYIAWQDADRSVRVQRLDATGHERWPHHGVAIQQQAGWWSSDFTTDAGDNAVFATMSGSGVAVAKVAPDGGLPWGAQGLTFPGSVVQSEMAVAATADGGLVGMWDEGRSLRLQKLDATGAAQWGAGIAIKLEAPFRAKQPKLVAADDASVIATWVADGYPVTTATAFAQKYALADGAALWGDGTPVALTGAFNNVMDFVLGADGAGGAVAAWVDGDVGSGTSLVVRAQHLDGAGAARLAEGGQPALGSPRRGAGYPAIAYDPPSGALHVVWAERPNNPVALYAQRFAADGSRVWGENGKSLLSLAENTYVSDHRVLPAPGGLLVAWADWGYGQPGTPPQLRAVRLDAEGRHLFPGERVGLKGGSTPTQALRAALSSAGYAAFVWGDSQGVQNDDILAQNIHFDGTLGNLPDPPDPPDPLDPIYADGFEG